MAIHSVFNWPLTKPIFRLHGNRFSVKSQKDHKRQKYKDLPMLCQILAVTLVLGEQTEANI